MSAPDSAKLIECFFSIFWKFNLGCKDLRIKSLKPSGSAKNVDFRESHSNRHRTAVRPPNELKICGDLVDGTYFGKMETILVGDLHSLPLPLDSGKFL